MSRKAVKGIAASAYEARKRLPSLQCRVTDPPFCSIAVTCLPSITGWRSDAAMASGNRWLPPPIAIGGRRVRIASMKAASTW